MNTYYPPEDQLIRECNRAFDQTAVFFTTESSHVALELADDDIFGYGETYTNAIIDLFGKLGAV